MLGLNVWPLGNGLFALDDRNVNYVELQAAAEAARPKLSRSSPSSGGMEMMDSLISGSGGTPVYLTNLVATLTNGSVTVTFSIAGGTNGFAYDIYSTTNLTNIPVYSQWTWLGQVYTTNSYTFTNQPLDYAFYILAIPRQTMVVAWGDDASGQCDVPSGLTNAIDVAGGYNFSLALKADGTVIAWGDNTYGESNVPAGLTNVTSIAAGGNFALALLQNGTVVAWGGNGNGQTNVPAGLTNVTAIAAGNAHAIALRNDGTVVAWGDNSGGQTNVPALGPVTQIAAGFAHSVALLTNGTVAVWGINGAGFGWNITNVPVGLSNVVSIAAGALHTLALKADGTVTAWGAGRTNTGFDNYGQSIVPAGLSNVVVVAGGYLYSMALQSDGTVVTWGDDFYGETDVPDRLTGVKAISAGGFHGLAIRSGLLTPVILQEPVNQYALPGDTVTFSSKGAGLYGVTYQWQFNGMNITGATNVSLTLTNVQAANVGSYQVIISDGVGAVTSDAATFAFLQPPQINSTTPALGANWITNDAPGTSVQVPLTVAATDGDPLKYPLSYQWSFNGTNIPDANGFDYLLSVYDNWGPTAPLEGNYTVAVSNAAGSTNVGTWNIRVLLAGMVAAWGADDDGECDRPVTLTNVAALAAGEYHSVAVTDSGSVVQWGYNWADVPANLTNAVAVSAGYNHIIAVRSDGTVTTWGYSNSAANVVPDNLSGVKAVAAGWEHNIALLTNGTVTAWGYNYLGQTNVPAGLTNVTAISACFFHSLALKGDGMVVGWGDNYGGETMAPAGLSNAVAIAAGFEHSLALKADGTVVAWGDNTYGQTNVPVGLSNVVAIAAGQSHSVALKNDGTVVAWGDNTFGQTNVPSTLANIKLIAAGGDHTLAAMFSTTVQYPVDVTKDLLLIYNTNSTDSVYLKDYYLAHRPLVGSANVLGIGCTTNESTSPSDFTNQIAAPLFSWLASNPTKRPSYIVMFLGVPTLVDGGFPNVGSRVRYMSVGCPPFVTYINMGDTNACRAYIDKVAYFGTNYSPGKLIISASGGGYANTNYYADGVNIGYGIGEGGVISNSLVSSGVSPAAITAVDGIDVYTNHIMQATNVAGYCSYGGHSTLTRAFVTNRVVRFYGQSSWFAMTTIESYAGRRYDPDYSTYVDWYSVNAFGGTNYEHTPVAAAANTDECSCTPDAKSLLDYWASGKNAAICCWQAGEIAHFQGATTLVVGDPLVKK